MSLGGWKSMWQSNISKRKKWILSREIETASISKEDQSTGMCSSFLWLIPLAMVSSLMGSIFLHFSRDSRGLYDLKFSIVGEQLRWFRKQRHLPPNLESRVVQSWNPHGGSRELTSPNSPLTFTCLLTYMYKHKNIHTHKYMK